MSWIDGLRYRARTLLRSGEHAREADDEMAHHLELGAMQAGDLYAARRRFGNRTYHTEERRRAAGIAWLDALRQDATYAWRSIRRSPGFTAAVVVTLALGVGINAATFSMLDTLFLRAPAGVRAPDELRRIWAGFYSAEGPFWTQNISYRWYRAVAEATGDTTRAALYRPEETHLGRGRGGPVVHVTYTTASYFPVLGVRAALGRLYTPAEDVMGKPVQICVVSDHFWRTHLRGDRGVLGDTLRLDTQLYTIVGVLPPDFAGITTQASEVFVPLAATPAPPWIKNPRWWEAWYVYGYQAVVRPRPGLTDEQIALRGTQALQRAVRARVDPPPSRDTLTVITAGSIIEARGPAKPAQDQIITTRLGGVAVIVLVIACANVLNLLLGRAVRRRREMAVRLALGMSRLRLARLLTTETVLLAVLAGSIALLVGWGSGTLLRRLLLPDVVWYDSVLGWRLAIFAIAAAAACGLLAGVVTAYSSGNPVLTPALKDGARESAGRGQRRLRGAMLALQAALSVVLLAGAALFTRSLRNVTHLDIGFDRDRLVFASADFEKESSVPDAVFASGLERIAERLRARPDVEAVSLSGIGPMAGFSMAALFTSTDSVRQQGPSSFPSYNAVSANFFTTTGLRFVRGRTFDEGVSNVVVNEAMAAALWPRREAVGECLYVGKRNGPCYRVTGVVETGRRTEVIEREPAPLFYIPLDVPDTAHRWNASWLNVRTLPGAQGTVATAIRAALAREFPQGYPTVRSMAEQLDSQYRPWRLGAQLFGAVSALALIVALVGIYSTVSYAVSQRTREFGVRVALGARTGNVLAQVLGEGLRVVALGTTLGVALTIAGGRLVAALLYGVKPSDPSTLVGVAVALLVTATFAALVPAWRAARVDPVKALRAD